MKWARARRPDSRLVGAAHWSCPVCSLKLLAWAGPDSPFGGQSCLLYELGHTQARVWEARARVTIVVLVNEIFANTGFQWSPATTPFAEPSTTPADAAQPGNPSVPLDYVHLAIAAGAQLVAQVSPSHDAARGLPRHAAALPSPGRSRPGARRLRRARGPGRIGRAAQGVDAEERRAPLHADRAEVGGGNQPAAPPGPVRLHTGTSSGFWAAAGTVRMNWANCNFSSSRHDHTSSSSKTVMSGQPSHIDCRPSGRRSTG
jgi:hypothetical protein